MLMPIHFERPRLPVVLSLPLCAVAVVPQSIAIGSLHGAQKRKEISTFFSNLFYWKPLKAAAWNYDRKP